MTDVGRRRLAWWLAMAFLMAVVMGAGPGTLLANRPATWFGLPQLYLWGVFWCTAEAVIVLLAYLFVWRGTED